MAISFRIHPQRNGSSPLGQELTSPPPPTTYENLLEMRRAGFEIFWAARAVNAKVFKAQK